MQTRAMLIVGLIVASAMAVGCEPWDPFETEPETAVVDDSQPADQPVAAAPMNPRDAELGQREEELAALQAAYADLEGQHRQLAEEAEEKEWVNAELRDAIRNLGDTVKERDQLVLTVEQLRVENIRLNKKIKELKSRLDVTKDQLATLRQMRNAPPEEAPSAGEGEEDAPAAESTVDSE